MRLDAERNQLETTSICGEPDLESLEWARDWVVNPQMGKIPQNKNLGAAFLDARAATIVTRFDVLQSAGRESGGLDPARTVVLWNDGGHHARKRDSSDSC